MIQYARYANRIIVHLGTDCFFAGFFTFFFTKSYSLRGWSFILFVVFFILTIRSHIEIVRKPKKMDKLLKKVSSTTKDGSIEDLKEGYNGIHSLYNRLSSKHQDKYKSQVNSVRTNIEKKMKNGKKIEKMLQDNSGTVEEKRIKYDQMFEVYQRLPRQEQKKYYAQIMHVRENLEKG